MEKNSNLCRRFCASKVPGKVIVVVLMLNHLSSEFSTCACESMNCFCAQLILRLCRSREACKRTWACINCFSYPWTNNRHKTCPIYGKAVSYRASMKLVIVGKEPLTSNEGLLSPCNVCMVIQVQSRKTQGKLKLVH